MSEPGEFIDAALQREGSWERASDAKARLESSLRFYGASVGAVRGTIRDVSRRYPGLHHDEILALCSELWGPALPASVPGSAPVFERRLATVVLLQSNLRLLQGTDLTRVEGFVRTGRLQALVDPLAVDVVGPLIELLDGRSRERANAVLDRWAADDDAWVRRAALLSPLRAFKAGEGDWASFTRRARNAQENPTRDEPGVALEAIRFMTRELANTRPELHL